MRSAEVKQRHLAEQRTCSSCDERIWLASGGLTLSRYSTLIGASISGGTFKTANAANAWFAGTYSYLQGKARQR